MSASAPDRASDAHPTDPSAPRPTPVATSPGLVGQALRLTVGAVAHGGHCVARIGPESGVAAEHVGRVVFVRHTLPGEDVTALVTEDTWGPKPVAFCRADAVEIHRPAADRVTPVCPYAGPGRCGGCDWQHVAPPAQLDLKAAVVRDALQRFAGLDVDVRVEPLPGGPWQWRTRTLFAVDRSAGPARLGLRRHRSHEIEPVAACPISAPGVGDAPGRFDPAQLRADVTGVEYVLGDAGTVTTVVHRPAADPGARPDRRHGGARRRARRLPDRTTVVAGPPTVWHAVAGRGYEVAATGFWQVHPLAGPTFAGAVLAGLRPVTGERALDLYAGAGLFTALLAEAVGRVGTVVGLETDAQAVADAAANLADLPWASVRRGRVDAATVAAAGPADLVVLDPPRTGAGADVVAAIAALRPRAVAYVACDPVALARDLATAAGHGYRLASLRAFDAFAMTQHVECVAILAPA